MRPLLPVILIIAFVPGAYSQFVIPPYISDVLDAASYSSGITPGGLFVVKGYNICPEGVQISPLPLQTRFNDVSLALKPDGGGEAISSYILYTYGNAGDYQIAAVLPSSAAPGLYDAAVTHGTRTISVVGKARVVAKKFRSLTNNQQGFGLAVVQNYVDAARVDRNMFVSGTVAGFTKAPAKPGQTVILWGLGLGAISRPDSEAPGVIDLRPSTDVRVLVGGKDGLVLYAGRSPEFPGVDQINFTLPLDAPTGCNVPLEVIVDGAASNPVTIAIAPSGKDACEHPFLSRRQLETLDQGGKFMAGEFNMMVYRENATSTSGESFLEIHSATGYFGEMTASRTSTVDADSIRPGTCVSWRSDGLDRGAFLDVQTDDSYDAGSVTLSGPGYSNAPLDDDDDWYLGMLCVRRVSDGQILMGDSQYLYRPGEYTLKGSGGSAIEAFEVKMQAPDALTWTNMDSIENVSRSLPLEVRWTGAGVKDRVIVQGGWGVVTGGSADDPLWDVGTFICAAAPGAQSFTVPDHVLKLLPKSGGLQAVGLLGVAAFAQDSRATFRAGVKAGTGLGTELGIGTFGRLDMTLKAVSYE